MQKHFLVLVVWLSLVSFSSFSQNDFRKGYIINIQGDTLHGYVAHTLKSKKYNLCVFKEGNNITEYKSEQIKLYSIEGGRTFVSGIVPELFVELLVKGEISLYKNESNFYVQKNDGESYALIRYQNKEKRTEDTRWRGMILDGTKTESKRWRGVLYYLVKDRMEGRVSPLEFKFSERYFTDLIRNYNIMGGEEYTVNKTDIPWTVIKIGAVGGLNYQSFYVDPDKKLFIEGFNNLTPFIGFALNISSPREFEKISLHFELQLSKLDVKERSFYGTEKEHVIEATKLSIPLALKYNFLEKKVNWHALGGFIADVNLNMDHYSSIYRGSSFEKDPQVVRRLSTEKTQIGYWGGIGAEKEFKKISVRFDVRYHRLSKLLYDDSLEVKENRLSFALVISKR